MSISTGTGDQGESGLFRGGRVPKDHVRLEAYGMVDELNAVLGVARAAGLSAEIDAELAEVSAWLFDLGADLATPGAGQEGELALRLGQDRIDALDAWIHRDEAALPALKSFILPGGSPAAAALHLARTVCRHAERRVVTLKRETGEAALAVVFLNRLGDLLFLWARRANREAGVDDVEWRGR